MYHHSPHTKHNPGSLLPPSQVWVPLHPLSRATKIRRSLQMQCFPRWAEGPPHVVSCKKQQGPWCLKVRGIALHSPMLSPKLDAVENIQPTASVTYSNCWICQWNLELIHQWYHLDIIGLYIFIYKLIYIYICVLFHGNDFMIKCVHSCFMWCRSFIDSLGVCIMFDWMPFWIWMNSTNISHLSSVRLRNRWWWRSHAKTKLGQRGEQLPGFQWFYPMNCWIICGRPAGVISIHLSSKSSGSDGVTTDHPIMSVQLPSNAILLWLFVVMMPNILWVVPRSSW